MILEATEKALADRRLLDYVGNLAVSLVQKQIEEGPWVPNAALTIAVKQGDKPLRDRGQLLSSITYRAEGPTTIVVGTNHPAAEILHNGGTVRPSRSKALAIPAGSWVRTLMRGTSPAPRQMLEQLRGSGWWVWRQKNVVLGQKKGGKKDPIPLFILRTSVTIPGRPFMRMSNEQVEKILSAVAAWVGGAR